MPNPSPFSRTADRQRPNGPIPKTTPNNPPPADPANPKKTEKATGPKKDAYQRTPLRDIGLVKNPAQAGKENGRLSPPTEAKIHNLNSAEADAKPRDVKGPVNKENLKPLAQQNAENGRFRLKEKKIPNDPIKELHPALKRAVNHLNGAHEDEERSNKPVVETRPVKQSDNLADQAHRNLKGTPVEPKKQQQPGLKDVTDHHFHRQEANFEHIEHAPLQHFKENAIPLTTRHEVKNAPVSEHLNPHLNQMARLPQMVQKDAITSSPINHILKRHSDDDHEPKLQPKKFEEVKALPSQKRRAPSDGEQDRIIRDNRNIRNQREAIAAEEAADHLHEQRAALVREQHRRQVVANDRRQIMAQDQRLLAMQHHRMRPIPGLGHNMPMGNHLPFMQGNNGFGNGGFPMGINMGGQRGVHNSGLRYQNGPGGMNGEFGGDVPVQEYESNANIPQSSIAFDGPDPSGEEPRDDSEDDDGVFSRDAQHYTPSHRATAIDPRSGKGSLPIGHPDISHIHDLTSAESRSRCPVFRMMHNIGAKIDDIF